MVRPDDEDFQGRHIGVVRPSFGFLAVSKEFIRDGNVSPLASMLALYVVSFRDEPEFSMTNDVELAGHFGTSLEKIREAMSELLEKGYAFRKKADADGERWMLDSQRVLCD